MRTSRAGSESGHALLLALCVLLVVSVAAALLAQTLDARLRSQQADLRLARLDLMVDAAVEETLARLASDPGYPGLEGQPYQIGTIESRVQRLGPSLVAIEASATGAGRGRRVRIRGVMGAGAVRVVEWRRGTVASAGSGNRR